MFNKKYSFIGLAVVVMLLMFNFLLSEPNNKAPQNSIITAPTASVVSTKGAVAPKQPSYTTLVKQYEGKRIQFDTNCQAIPSYATYKNKVSIMFDNRSGQTRVIKIGTNSYTFQPFSYKILTLSSSKLPTTLNINCGTSVNVARILLQS
jgi:hypothetical protein